MNDKLKLWEVDFDSVFSSSSGMQKYSYENNHLVYVVTNGDSIEAVRNTLEKSLDNQSSVSKINKATYLGEIYNPLNK